MHLHVTARGAEMVATRPDGVEHSRWPVGETDPLEVLSRQEVGEPALGRPWSLATMDAALSRQGYERIVDWSPGHGGLTCEVITRMYPCKKPFVQRRRFIAANGDQDMSVGDVTEAHLDEWRSFARGYKSTKNSEPNAKKRNQLPGVQDAARAAVAIENNDS